MLEKQQKRIRRRKRVRAKISGTSKVPRLCVFRSNKHIYAQLIDDEKSRTLVSASDLEFKKNKRTKLEKAKEVGKLIAKKALVLPVDSREEKIEKVVFDRGGHQYHGRAKAVAEGAREGGLHF